jgi:protein-S-isoprenylcysteine O-methyltransferase Ste14
MVLVGWVALVYRIYAEERILANDPGWAVYAARVKSRLIPWLW